MKLYLIVNIFFQVSWTTDLVTFLFLFYGDIAVVFYSFAFLKMYTFSSSLY